MIDFVHGAWSGLWGAPWGRAALTIAIGLVAVKLAAALVARSVSRRGESHASLVAKKAVMYLGTVALLLGAAKAADVDLTAYLAAAGFLTVAIGFAAQTSIGNLVAGIFLLVDRPFEVGDHVQIDEKHGYVESISLLSTHVRTFDNLLIRWPNDTVLRAMIINFARNPARRLDLPFRVAHGTALETARRVVCEGAQRCRYVLIDPPPAVWGVRIEEDGVALELRAWVDRAEFLDARTELVIAIHDSLRDAGIEIPYPQLTVSRGTRPFAGGAGRSEPSGEARSSAGAERLDSQLAEPDPT